MNLADAIRRAACAAGDPILPEPGAGPHRAEIPSEAPEREPEHESPESATEPVSGGMVRLELFLEADELAALFKIMMARSHAVLTLREAAQYLRISTSTLERMAAQGEVPALRLEGRWRFPKQALSAWLESHATRPKENESHVA